MEAIPIAIPPRILKNTINDIDSGSIEGKPEPQAEIPKSTAEMSKEFFLPIDLETTPADAAPNKAPNKALLTMKPFNHPVNSKYFEK